MSKLRGILRYEREDGSVLARFSSVEEWLEFKTDVFDRNWSSIQAPLSFEELDEAYYEALHELEAQNALWAFEEQHLVDEYLHCLSDDEYERYTCSLEELKNPHNVTKIKRSKRIANTIRTSTNLVKQFMPGSLFQQRYQNADSMLKNIGKYVYERRVVNGKHKCVLVISDPPSLEIVKSEDTVSRFKSRVKLASHYEDYFLVAGHFVKYDPMPKENRHIMPQEHHSNEPDVKTPRSKFYIPEIPLSSDPMWNRIMKSYQEYLLKHSPKYHGKLSYLPKKKSRSCKIYRSCKNGAKSSMSHAISSHNQLPTIYHMSVLLRHFISGNI